MNVLFETYAFVFGALVGSFSNVCVFRIPRQLSIVSPRSKCIRCGHLIRFYDNIPLLSFLFLGGKCRACSTPIGIRYPLIELAIGFAAWGFYRKFGLSLQGTYFFILTTALIVASFIDLEHRIIPNSISITGIWTGLAMAGWTTWLAMDWPVTLKESFLGILLGGGLLWGVGKTYEILTGREGIGFGDVKLLALFGAHAGVMGVLTSLLYASAAGSVAGLLLMVFHGKGRRYPIPFGPFLCAGLGVYALFGHIAMDVPITFVGDRVQGILRFF